VENTIRTMALAELWFGQGRGLRNFICLGARSGLGAGIIIDGQVYRGADNRAGEIGDWPCIVNGVNGAGGSAPAQPFTRLEDIASFQVVQNRLAASARTGPDSPAGPRTEVPVEALVQAALAGDEIVLGFLDQVAHALGLALNQLNCAFNPQKIILAGAFTVFGDVFLRRLQQSLHTFAPPAGAPLVVNTQLGSFNGAIGAAALAVHEWKPLPC
jgi:N-acetylglucosamine repressor